MTVTFLGMTRGGFAGFGIVLLGFGGAVSAFVFAATIFAMWKTGGKPDFVIDEEGVHSAPSGFTLPWENILRAEVQRVMFLPAIRFRVRDFEEAIRDLPVENQQFLRARGTLDIPVPLLKESAEVICDAVNDARPGHRP